MPTASRPPFLLLLWRTALLVVASTLCSSLGDADSDETCAVRYGADVSYPMRSRRVISTTLLEGDRQKFYQANLQGCEDHYSATPKRCRQGEDERIEMIQRQPSSMINYTQMGFAKRQCPEDVWRLVQDFWQTNRKRTVEEKWPVGSTYGNHWKVPTHLVAIENATLQGGGEVLKHKIWNALRPGVSKWTGQHLADSALFGIRIYHGGAVLAPHVDRSPLVVGAILNVDQDTEEPWPLEVIAHDGWAYNITIQPGELILYESHSIIHGRPFPLKGSFLANLFVHYETLGSLTASETPIYRGDLPPYLIPNSPQEPVWRQRNPNGWRARKPRILTPGTTEAHQAVSMNDQSKLQTILTHYPEMVHAQDDNGWTPLHEAVRKAILNPSRGRMDVVKALVEEGGANVNALTKNQDSALGLAHHFALQREETDHPVLQYLEELGTKRILNGQEIV